MHYLEDLVSNFIKTTSFNIKVKNTHFLYIILYKNGRTRLII